MDGHAVCMLLTRGGTLLCPWGTLQSRAPCSSLMLLHVQGFCLESCLRNKIHTLWEKKEKEAKERDAWEKKVATKTNRKHLITSCLMLTRVIREGEKEGMKEFTLCFLFSWWTFFTFPPALRYAGTITFTEAYVISTGFMFYLIDEERKRETILGNPGHVYRSCLMQFVFCAWGGHSADNTTDDMSKASKMSGVEFYDFECPWKKYKIISEQEDRETEWNWGVEWVKFLVRWGRKGEMAHRISIWNQR